MPTTITQIDDSSAGQTTLKVKGEMSIEDARLLEHIGDDIRSETGHQIRIDLADLDFLDSDSAPFLKRLEARDGFKIEGIEIFLQTLIDRVERHEY
ncbi:MAG: hypothetical protein ABJA02_15410 [Acidobacteriota bacterium]